MQSPCKTETKSFYTAKERYSEILGSLPKATWLLSGRVRESFVSKAVGPSPAVSYLHKVIKDVRDEIAIGLLRTMPGLVYLVEEF